LYFSKVKNFKLFPKPSSDIEYPECDGIRGIAILLVFWLHCTYGLDFRGVEYSYWNIFYISAHSGFYGVQLFFVLSAYLLFFSQYSRILNGKSPQKISHFMIRRFFRIAPVYYLSIFAIVYFVNTGLAAENKFKYTLLHLLFLHIFDMEVVKSINAVTWSLGVEFFFYLVLPFVILISFKFNNLWNRNRARYLNIFLTLFISLSIIVIVLNTTSLFAKSATSFCFGVLAAVASHAILQQSKIKIWQSTLVGVFSIIGALSIHYYLYYIGQKSDRLFNEYLISNIPLISFFYAISLVVASQKDYILYPILSFFPLRIIGLFSYEIYIIHVFIINHWTTKFHFYNQMNHLSPVINGSIILFFTVIAAGLIHFFISRPFIQISSSMIKKKSTQSLPRWMQIANFAFLSITLGCLLHLIITAT